MSLTRVTMGLGRMLVSLGGLLVAFVVFTLLMMLRGSAVRPCSILVVLSSSRMGFLRHFLLQCDEVAKEKHLNRAEVSAVSQIFPGRRAQVPDCSRSRVVTCVRSSYCAI